MRRERLDDVGAALDERGVRHRHSHHENLEAARMPGSALSRLVPRIGLIDDVDPSLTADNPAPLVALLQCLERIDDLHIHALVRAGT
jgi:hypothetical protein